MHLERYNSADLGMRLRAERKRIGISQAILAGYGGVQRNALVKYEKGENSPTVEFLYKLASKGVDVAYIVNGERSEVALSPIEQVLLTKFNELDLNNKQIAIGMIAALSGDRSGFEWAVQPDDAPPTLHSPRSDFRAKPSDD